MKETSLGRNAVRFSAAVVIALAGMLIGASAAFAATFDPTLVISNDNMRHYDSMSASQIQAFLETQPGPLADLVTRDYDKVITLSKTKNNYNTTPDKGEKPKPASLIIWEACQAWKINPKVMLVMLQKEQSLLTRTTLKSTTLARAVGAGCPGRLVYPSTNPVATNRYPGFGNQIWHGARLLDGYGEGKNGSTVRLYFPGIAVKDIYRKPQVTLHPKNIATYKLYVYNPSIGAKKPYGDLSTQSCSGNANFWKIYSKYFGSPLSPPRIRPVYRFRNRYNGNYLYTASIVERLKLRRSSRKWEYGGAKFSWDTSVSPTATKPMYRFFDRRTRKYSFVSSQSTYEYRRSADGRRRWTYSGVAWRISKETKFTPGAQSVHRLRNRTTGGILYTASKSHVDLLRRKYARKWRYEGIGFYMPRYSAPTTPTP
jgi:hypothetical protein